jgi:hypothetical protein
VRDAGYLYVRARETMTTRILLLWLGIILYSAVHAEVQIEDISAQLCVTGEHKQPSGPYALYVFCDDALGTNVAVFLKELGVPFSENYDLGKRFWHGIHGQTTVFQ